MSALEASNTDPEWSRLPAGSNNIPSHQLHVSHDGQSIPTTQTPSVVSNIVPTIEQDPTSAQVLDDLTVSAEEIDDCFEL